MSQSLILKPCVLDRLVKYFVDRYLDSRDYHGRRDRVRLFRDGLSCDKIRQKQVGEDELVKILGRLWSRGVRAYIREAIKREGINNILSKLEHLACKDSWEGGSREVLKKAMFSGFGVASLTELATSLYPDEFFIYNNPIRDSLMKLINKGVIKRIDLPNIHYRDEFWKLYENVEELINNILDTMRRYIQDANYLDVDAFLYDRTSLTDEILEKAEKECSEKTLVSEIIPNSLRELILNALKDTKQVILYGVPGTGKTMIALRLAKEFAGDESRVEFITFHSSYSYEEFIEGLRISLDEKGLPRLHVEHGVFKNFVIKATCDLMNHILENNGDLSRKLGIIDSCRGLLSRIGEAESYSNLINKALEEIYLLLGKISSSIDRERIRELVNKAPRYVFVIDEINRGDIARIFGEIITLLEIDKRLFEENQIIVTLPYSKKKFFIPPNLYVIGTMNSADRSIALVDYALRRRFTFIELEPDSSKVPGKIKRSDGQELHDFNLREFFEILNNYVEKELDRDHRIGHSYFMKVETIEDLRQVWFTHIRSLLMEYFYGKDDDLRDKLGDLYTKPYIDSDDEFIELVKKALRNLREPSG